MLSFSEALSSLFYEKKIYISNRVRENISINKIINDLNQMQPHQISDYLLELENNGYYFFHYLFSPYYGDVQYKIPSKILIKNIFDFDSMMAEAHKVSLIHYRDWHNAFKTHRCIGKKVNGKYCNNIVYPPISAKDFNINDHAFCHLHSKSINIAI